MSDKQKPELSVEEQQFWDAVDQFIEIANKATEEGDIGIVRSAMVYAAARYSAFNLASVAENRREFLSDSEDAVEHLSREFSKVLAENMADYGENYKVYLRAEE